MGDISESGAPETSESRLAALRSSSTNVRIEVLRKLLNEIQNTGMMALRLKHYLHRH